MVEHIMSKGVGRPASHIKGLGHVTTHGMHASLVILLSDKGRGVFALHGQNRNTMSCHAGQVD